MPLIANGLWAAFFFCLQLNSCAFLGLVALETMMVNDVIKPVDTAVMTNSCRPKLILAKSVTNQNLSV